MVRARALRVLPESRSECRDGARPCPLVSCRFHLLLDTGAQAVNPRTQEKLAGQAQLHFTRTLDESSEDDIADVLREMPETCALDVADRGATTSRAIAELLGINRRQGVEELVSAALEKIREGDHEFDEREHPDDPYLKYCNMGADELAEITAELRARSKRGDHR
jgi:hypothetical protein